MKKINRRKAIQYSVGVTVASLTGASILTACNETTEKSDKNVSQTATEGKVSDPDYTLQANIEGLNVPKVITIIGAGRLGSWAAYYAVISGVEKLIIFDSANVDPKDVATTPFMPSQTGKSKVNSVKDIIHSVRPKTEVVVNNRYFYVDKDEALLEGAVINAAAEQDLRRLLPAICTKKGLRYSAGGYSGAGVVVMNMYPTTSVISESDSPVWAGSAALSALLAFHSICLTPINFAGSVSDFSLTNSRMTSMQIQTIMDGKFKVFGSEKP